MAGKEEGSRPHPSQAHSAGPWGALPQSQSNLKEQTLGEGEGRPPECVTCVASWPLSPCSPSVGSDASVPAPGSPARVPSGHSAGVVEAVGCGFGRAPSSPQNLMAGHSEGEAASRPSLCAAQLHRAAYAGAGVGAGGAYGRC